MTSRRRFAGKLTDVSKLRYQAVFLMGAGGSGKGYVGYKWLKYMPGGSPTGASRAHFNELVEESATEQERGLTNLNFEKVKDRIEQTYGFRIDVTDTGDARIPFRLYDYDAQGRQREISPDEWETDLPPKIYKDVQGLSDLVFNAPVHELPSYWRQANPDLYKEEIRGYREKQPGYVHEMSSEASKAYFEAAVESGDPLFVDGTGANAKKLAYQMKRVKENGYRISLVLVLVPLTVNHIRNATRARNVNPTIVSKQWHKIKANYVALKSMADSAKVIINRNDPSDIKRYKKHADKINNFVRRTTNHDSLYDLIQAEQPGELKQWGRLLQTGMTGREDSRIEQLRREKGITRKYARSRLARRVAHRYVAFQSVPAFR